MRSGSSLARLLVETHDRHSAHTPPQPPAPAEQLSLFGADVFPVLPSAHEQQKIIEQTAEPTPEPPAVEQSTAVSLPDAQNEIDALLTGITDADKARLNSQISAAPRSREAAQLEDADLLDVMLSC